MENNNFDILIISLFLCVIGKKVKWFSGKAEWVVDDTMFSLKQKNCKMCNLDMNVLLTI